MRRPAWAGVALVCVLGMPACTPSQGSEPTPAITPANPTRGETEFERQQRLDFEAAEKTYRAFRTEYRRVLSKGGAAEATSTMKATAGGPYLAEFVPVIKGYRTRKWVQRGPEKIIYIRRTVYRDPGLVLEVCEDGRSQVTYDSNGKVIGRGELRTATLEMKPVDGKLKLWEGDGKKVAECPG